MAAVTRPTVKTSNDDQTPHYTQVNKGAPCIDCGTTGGPSKRGYRYPVRYKGRCRTCHDAALRAIRPPVAARPPAEVPPGVDVVADVGYAIRCVACYNPRSHVGFDGLCHPCRYEIGTYVPDMAERTRPANYREYEARRAVIRFVKEALFRTTGFDELTVRQMDEMLAPALVPRLIDARFWQTA